VTTLILARHGETDWNAQHRWQGHSDPPLNARGREQARALAKSIEHADVVYASDLSRARETAEIVAAKLGLDVRLDARLRERSFGAWEGLTSAEIEERFAELYARWTKGESHGAEDAEPHDGVAARIASFLDDVASRHPEELVLVVAHGGSLRVIAAAAAGLEYATSHHALPPLANCGVFRCEFRDGILTRLD
jgi:broad specificity phosphatase PhoE